VSESCAETRPSFWSAPIWKGYSPLCMVASKVSGDARCKAWSQSRRLPLYYSKPGDKMEISSKTVCPHAGGAKSWIPASYNAVSKMLYAPLVGNYRHFWAVNMETKKIVSTNRQRDPQTSGALGTAGGIVFADSIDRVIKAYDESTGTVLWQTSLNDVPNSCPISYSVNWKQYIAVVGNGGAQIWVCSNCPSKN
jgi:hypothetical protein